MGRSQGTGSRVGPPVARRVRGAVRDRMEQLGDRLDTRIVALHRPTVSGDSGWCAGHPGGPHPWPCREYTEAADALAARHAVYRDPVHATRG